MPGAVIIFRVPLQDLYALRNALYRFMSILQNGYGGTLIGISNDAEHVPPLRMQPLLNVGMGMVYFTKYEDAKRFSYNEQPFMSADFLNNAEVFIVPVLTPLLIGSHATALFITEIRNWENYSQLPDPKLMLTMSACGAVPLVADCKKVHLISGSEDRICGIRISQFPNKSAFYDWVKSDRGTKFRQAILRIRSLTSYIATFTRDAL
ncbi:hypothetical protein CRM22_009087 [Opisthorchis felineus]|uniref:Uncharacterized protein n=2 Tax=Opisthorchis felineus TaxID=147828 RepID=A0A4S2L922_OPIFE|nr:hypothetical protein CRM22_009087 [Opisthorchis felineus]